LGLYQPNPNIEADSQAFAEEAEALHQKHVKGARDVIYLNLKKHAEFYTSLLDKDIQPEEVPVYKLKADVARGNLKLGGLEVERTEHSGQVAFKPFLLSREEDGSV